MFIRASIAAPDSYQYQVGMGWCYLKLGQQDDARGGVSPGDEARAHRRGGA